MRNTRLSVRQMVSGDRESGTPPHLRTNYNLLFSTYSLRNAKVIVMMLSVI